MPAGQVASDLAVVARRRWRDYRTPAGGRPVREFLASLTFVDRAAAAAAMRRVRVEGVRAARHVRHEIFEVRAFAIGGSHRILFAVEGRRGQVFLALHAFSKHSQKTPAHEMTVAQRRLRDWRGRRRARA